MRRPLVVLVAALLAVRVAAAEPPASTDSLRAVVHGPSLVRFDRARIDAAVPAWKGRPLALRHHGGSLREVEGTARPDLPADVVLMDRGARGTRLELRPADRPSTDADGPAVRLAPGGTTNRARIVIDVDRVFGELANAIPENYAAPDIPLWFLAAVPRGGKQAIEFKVSGGIAPAPEGTLAVSVRMARTHMGEVRVRGTWNGADLGVAGVPPGMGVATFSFEVPLSALPPATDDVKLELVDESPPPQPSGDPNDTSEGVGTVWVDTVELVVPRPGDARDRAVFEDGLESSVTPYGMDLFAPQADAPDPVAATKGAAMVVLATKDLLEGARRLAEHRTRNGIPTVVVPAADVWNRRSLGAVDPEALRAFLADVAAGGALRYVLLCGDATLDRGDVRPGIETIPTLYGRSLYNGATASDRLLVGHPSRGTAPAVGRLPFRDAKELDAYVARVIAAETTPPADVTRRTLRFITSEGRFGPQIDALIENLFAQVVATQIPPAYDTEVTFARVGSPLGWPPAEFADKVLGDLNAGSLFYTYVGHGFALGFDHLRVEGQRFPILDADQVPKVDIRGTPPAMFVVACTTAIYDYPDLVGVGERLLARPHGPLAYWGATRVCHPAWNSIVGRQLAMEMFRDPGRRIGDILEAAVRAAAAPPPDPDAFRRTIEMGARFMLGQTKADLDRLKLEGAEMYNLLGDPALRLPFPKEDLVVSTARTAAGVEVTVTGPIPDGMEIRASVETTRDRIQPWTTDDTLSPEENTRRRHARSNDKSLARGTVRASGGKATWAAALPANTSGALVVKAWAVFGNDVHQGAAAVPEPAGPR
ncbi:MAG TPA: C25 family cysteine peptidase [Planctomycetota bacterium]|nr:C25 family cysteine peptidase [Planctomycetota bacterium]